MIFARFATRHIKAIVFVTLGSRQGYLRQELGPDGMQIDHPDPWDLEARTIPLDASVAVRIEGHGIQRTGNRERPASGGALHRPNQAAAGDEASDCRCRPLQ